MKRWGISIAALAILGSLFSFSALNNDSHVSPKKGSMGRDSAKNAFQNKIQNQPTANIQQKKVEIKQIVETQAIPYQSITQNDNLLIKGSDKVITQGVNGLKNITYKVTYVDGVETVREKVSESVVLQPIDQITKIGTGIVVSPAPPAGPAGATALCTDGSISYAQHHWGACSRHGGVAIWYR